MKKFLYLAIMALTVGFFASCSAGGNSSDYYKNGKKPQIDVKKATVNGKKYDNKTEKCWYWTKEGTAWEITSSSKTYVYLTEFDLVVGCEEALYLVANRGGKASYSYFEVKGYEKDPGGCLENNDKN